MRIANILWPVFYLNLIFAFLNVTFGSPRSSDLYDRLGLSKGASQQDIKKSFHKMAMKYHPDKMKSKDPKSMKEAEEKFRYIAEAYEILKDENKKARYDSGDSIFSSDDLFNGKFDMRSFFKNFDQAFSSFGTLMDDLDGSEFGDFSSFFGGQRRAFQDSFDFMAREDLFPRHGQGHKVRHEAFHAHSGRRAGRNCKTVTKRSGNRVSTHTTCS